VTADELFGKLGFTSDESKMMYSMKIIELGRQCDLIIVFDKSREIVVPIFSTHKTTGAISLTGEHLKAINKKFEELGWLK